MLQCSNITSYGHTDELRIILLKYIEDALELQVFGNLETINKSRRSQKKTKKWVVALYSLDCHSLFWLGP